MEKVRIASKKQVRRGGSREAGVDIYRVAGHSVAQCAYSEAAAPDCEIKRRFWE
jgi:hypothetical protein